MMAVAVWLMASAGVAYAGDLPLAYVASAKMAGKDALIVDARPSDLCEDATLPGARCLPADDFLGLDQRLAGFANIAWLLGSAGLTGAEKVLVIGANPVRRDFVAGLLYIMGQAEVLVLSKGVAASKTGLEAGEPRDTLRTRVWQAASRDEVLIFVNELQQLLHSKDLPILLDGRAEKAYWGREIRAARGGHLPGAEHLPASELRADVQRGDAAAVIENSIVYGRSAVDGIAYMTLIIAGSGTQVRVFPGGWAKWAANGALPADAETFSRRLRKPASAAQLISMSSPQIWTGAAAGLLLGGSLVFIGMWAHARRKGI